MAYHLKVYDNFHYTDESEADEIGSYASYDEALQAAKAIVDSFLVENWKTGIAPEKLFGRYDDFGNDPSIIPDNPLEQNLHEHFSARNYAQSRVEAICKTLELQNRNIQTRYQEAIKFASSKHTETGQKVPGTNLPYEVHLSNVAMEILIASFNTPSFDTAFAVQVALLHDTIEDTSTTFHELENKFGIEIAQAVSALSKNQHLPKAQQMLDSLNRIKTQPTEVWSVKLADRITNLQPPPAHWTNEKKLQYLQEAKSILQELGSANTYLSSRLSAKIKEYQSYQQP